MKIRLWQRPSLYIALLSILAYWDETALRGSYVYDDAGSIQKNVVVNGSVPWTEVFTRDFWGTPMSDVQSHKSFRPITTLSFRLNWILSETLGTVDDRSQHTFGFHVVNVVLHGIVTAMVTEASAFVFDGGSQGDLVAQVVTGAIFGVHPVHAEAVSNLTSRGELLMSWFFLCAFLSYAGQVYHGRIPRRGVQSFFAIYVIPWLCMTLSLFCKEQGATTLISLVIYDFVHNHGSVKQYLHTLSKGKDAGALAFLRRTVGLAVQTLLTVGWRYYLNGETSPDFIYNQNPAGFSSDRFTRVFSVSWVYCLYIRDALDPRFLAPDWSGRAIDLIQDVGDMRICLVLALWAVAGLAVYSLVMGLSPQASAAEREFRRVALLAFWAFLFAPFLLSSNILVVVGLMKADRVIYLPLMGFCLFEALILKAAFFPEASSLSNKTGTTTATITHRLVPSCMRSTSAIVGYTLVMLQMYFFCGKVHQRNVAWSHSLNLWVSAYRVNPRSYHTMYNCGYELAQKQRWAEAERVMREVRDPHVDGASNTFVYAMVLFNMGRCDEANPLIDEAFRVVDQKKANPGVRDDERSLARLESNLLVSKGFCSDELPQKGRLFYDAVQTDPTNEYAVQQATKLAKEVERIREHQGYV